MKLLRSEESLKFWLIIVQRVKQKFVKKKTTKTSLAPRRQKSERLSFNSISVNTMELKICLQHVFIRKTTVRRTRHAVMAEPVKMYLQIYFLRYCTILIEK